MSTMNRAKVDILINQDRKYYPGDIVEGKVCCTFYGVAHTREITLRLEREELIEWLDGKILWCGEDKFVLLAKVLSQDDVYDAGQHVFPFLFQLPEELSGTFSFRNGCVNYFLRTAILTEAFSSYAEKEITIASHIDFNKLPDKNLIEKQHNETVEKPFPSLFCLGDGAIAVDVSLQKTGFVLEEEAHVSVNVNNTSKRNISRMEVYIIQDITLKATSPINKSTVAIYALVRSKQEGVKSGDHKCYNFTLKIPRTAVIPDFSQCKLFSKRCVIEVVAVLPKSRNVKIRIPVILGHVPLSSDERFGSDYVPQHRRGHLSSTSSGSTVPSSRSLPYHSCQPSPTPTPSSDTCRNVANGDPPPYQSVCHEKLQNSASRSLHIQASSLMSPSDLYPPENPTTSCIPVPVPLPQQYPPYPPMPRLPPSFQPISFSSSPPCPTESSSKWTHQTDVPQRSATTSYATFPSEDTSPTTQASNENYRSRWDLVRAAVPKVAANHYLPYPSEISPYSNRSLPISSLLFTPTSMADDRLYPTPRKAVRFQNCSSTTSRVDVSPNSLPIGFGLLETVVSTTEHSGRSSIAVT